MPSLRGINIACGFGCLTLAFYYASLGDTTSTMFVVGSLLVNVLAVRLAPK